MPLLRELAARGAVFDWAFAPSNVTRRSIPSMVTGLAPNRVRGRVVGWALRVDPRHVLLAERMRAGGYETAGFVCCYGFWGRDFRTGLQRGLAAPRDRAERHEAREAGARVARRTREAAAQRKPLFLWMHILEPHNWQSAAARRANDEERRRFYDRSLDRRRRDDRRAARRVRAALAGARADRDRHRRSRRRRSASTATPYHSTDLYNSQIRVPLVIAGPGIKPGAHPRDGQPHRSHADDPRARRLRAADGQRIDGRSFADLATGRRARQRRRRHRVRRDDQGSQQPGRHHRGRARRAGS